MNLIQKLLDREYKDFSVKLGDSLIGIYTHTERILGDNEQQIQKFSVDTTHLTDWLRKHDQRILFEVAEIKAGYIAWAFITGFTMGAIMAACYVTFAFKN